MENESVWLVMADLIGSRSLTDKQGFHKNLELQIASLNKKFSHGLVQHIHHWKGIDELAFVSRSAGIATQMMLQLNTALLPQQYRFVLIEKSGLASAQLLGRMVSESSHDIYEQGATQMQVLKKEAVASKVISEEVEMAKALENQLNAFYFILQGFSEKQQMLWQLMNQRTEEAAGQKEWAAALGVSQQAVSRMVHTMRATQLQEIQENILRWAFVAFASSSKYSSYAVGGALGYIHTGTKH